MGAMEFCPSREGVARRTVCVLEFSAIVQPQVGAGLIPNGGALQRKAGEFELDLGHEIADL
jgi:hypothetical protein